MIPFVCDFRLSYMFDICIIALVLRMHDHAFIVLTYFKSVTHMAKPNTSQVHISILGLAEPAAYHAGSIPEK